MTNIIGDIAGNYLTFKALIDKMPEGEVVGVGDLIDRGPRSKEVLEWFMEHGRAIRGNHEHMMIDHHNDSVYYERGLWLYNGGGATFANFDYKPLPTEILNWVKRMPLYLEIDGCLISHSFVGPQHDLESACKLGDTIRSNKDSILWCRKEPHRIEGYKMQIAGHNSQFNYRRWSDEQGEFAVCLDSSASKVLTGIHLPSMEVFQQKYID